MAAICWLLAATVGNKVPNGRAFGGCKGMQCLIKQLLLFRIAAGNVHCTLHTTLAGHTPDFCRVKVKRRTTSYWL